MSGTGEWIWRKSQQGVSEKIFLCETAAPKIITYRAPPLARAHLPQSHLNPKHAKVAARNCAMHVTSTYACVSSSPVTISRVATIRAFGEGALFCPFSFAK